MLSQSLCITIICNNDSNTEEKNFFVNYSHLWSEENKKILIVYLFLL